jgi:hypothetical protein
MPGPGQPWDQPEDPGDQTADLPRVDPSNSNGSVNGGRAGSPPPGRELPSRNGHSPVANGVPQWQALPKPPSEHLPDVNGDPYAKPGPQGRPGPPIERPAPVGSTRPEPPTPAHSPPTPLQSPPTPPQSPPAPPQSPPAPPQSPAPDTTQAKPASRPEPDRRTGGRPGPGSLADLRSRLDRLPEGHPSSPYDDGGSARPLPHRLKQLELGLPAPERDAVDASPQFSRPNDARESTEAGRAGQPARGSAGDSPPEQPDAGLISGTEAGRADQHRARGDAASGNRARHDRHDATDPGTHPYRELRPAAGPPDNGQLGREASELVAGMLADGRAAEGQTIFGGYGASGLTPVIRRIADQLSRGGLAPGSEATTIKPAERLSAKLARLMARHPDRTASELVASICDVVRYAFAFEPESFTEGTWLVHRKLKVQGFELEARRNRWESPEYKGIWTRWRDPASDLSFEIQFHTFASWDVLLGTHEAYRTITDPATPPAERARLRAGQVAAAARAKVPPNCAEIVDFAKGAR